MKLKPYFVFLGLLAWPACVDLELGEQVGTEVGNPFAPEIEKNDPTDPKSDVQDTYTNDGNQRPEISNALVKVVKNHDGTLQIIGEANAVTPGVQIRGIALRTGKQIHTTKSNEDGSFSLSILDGDIDSIVRFHAETVAGRSSVVEASADSSPRKFHTRGNVHTLDKVYIRGNHTRNPAQHTCLEVSNSVIDVIKGEKGLLTINNQCAKPVQIFHNWQLGSGGIHADLPGHIGANETGKVFLTVEPSADDFDLLIITGDPLFTTPPTVVTVTPISP